MDSPISVGDGIDAKQAVLAAFRGQIWHPAEQPITLDPAINHNMRDVNAERAVLARQFSQLTAEEITTIEELYHASFGDGA